LVVVVNEKDMEGFGLITVQALSDDECDDVVSVAAKSVTGAVEATKRKS
jgi:hypothetical protein